MRETKRVRDFIKKMSRDERSLILYFEAVAVDSDGMIDCRKMNAIDFSIVTRWNDSGLIAFKRRKFSDIAASRTNHVVLSEEAWVIAHSIRRSRALQSALDDAPEVPVWNGK